MKTKTFDCVQMKRQAQERIRKELENLTLEEELEYWRKIMEEAIARREEKGQTVPARRGQ